MSSKLQKYAWVGLVLSGASAVFSLVYYFLYRKFDLPVQIGIGLAIIGLALYALLDPQKLREAFTGKKMKYGSNMIIFTIAVLGILVVINVLVNNTNTSWDLTEDQSNTLSKESIQILQALPDKVQVLAFYSQNYSTDTVKTLLENMKTNSNGKLEYEFVDPNNDPVRTQQYSVNTDGTLVLVMGDRQQSTKVASEEELDTALIKLSNPTESSVYFLSGHGEHDPTQSTDDGMATAASMLTKKSYTVKSLNLLTDASIPDDADVLVIAGPKQALSTDEVAQIKEFVAKGKSLVVMEDSPVTNDIGEAPDPLADYLKTDWGIQLDPSLVIDYTSNSPLQAVASKYGNHPIVNRLANIVTIFPSARSLTLANAAPDGITLTALVESSDNSYAETDMTALKNSQYQYDKTSDIAGPITLAAAGTNSKNNSRVVVVGSSYFAVDRNFNAYGNGDFLVNAIDWSAENESMINLTPKKSTNRILVAPNSVGMGVIFLLSVVAVPLVILILGIIVWAQRRKRS